MSAVPKKPKSAPKPRPKTALPKKKATTDGKSKKVSSAPKVVGSQVSSAKKEKKKKPTTSSVTKPTESKVHSSEKKGKVSSNSAEMSEADQKALAKKMLNQRRITRTEREALQRDVAQGSVSDFYRMTAEMDWTRNPMMSDSNHALRKDKYSPEEIKRLMDENGVTETSKGGGGGGGGDRTDSEMDDDEEDDFSFSEDDDDDDVSNDE